MPYINERDRSKSGLNHEGDLNYRIHELIEIYLNGQEKLGVDKASVRKRKN